jgi:hypothetical protein
MPIIQLRIKKEIAMNGEPSKHLNPLPAPAKTSAGALSAENLLKLWEQNTGHQPPDLKMEVLRELAETLWAPSNARSDDIDNKIAFALLRLAEIQPQDPMEWTLGEQMVATHTAAMDCYRRAALPNTAMEERQAELRQAQKLCQLHAHQIEVLDKHRGRGDRTVTVKHEVSHSHAD